MNYLVFICSEMYLLKMVLIKNLVIVILLFLGCGGKGGLRFFFWNFVYFINDVKFEWFFLKLEFFRFLVEW